MGPAPWDRGVADPWKYVPSVVQVKRYKHSYGDLLGKWPLASSLSIKVT